MGIADRNLVPGTKLVATYKKETYRAEVVAGEDGKPKYRLADGREFKSPSAAGTAITGKACNGWAFWSVEASEPQVEEVADASEERSETTEHGYTHQEQPEAEAQDVPEQEVPAEAAQEPVVVGFRRVPNQRGVPEGEVRLYCDTCRESFTAPVGQQPETCPQGHRPGAAVAEDVGAEEEVQS